MAWTLEFEAAARKHLRKLPRDKGERILVAMDEISKLTNPRQRGHALVGNQTGHWRYRIGDYRVIARIEEDRLVIVALAIGHRREVYR